MRTGQRTRSSWGSAHDPPRIGFYGCAGGVVRVEFANGEAPEHPADYPRAMRISCPGCGHEHIIKPAWRKRVEAIDSGRVPDYLIESA